MFDLIATPIPYQSLWIWSNSVWNLNESFRLWKKVDKLCFAQLCPGCDFDWPPTSGQIWFVRSTSKSWDRKTVQDTDQDQRGHRQPMSSECWQAGDTCATCGILWHLQFTHIHTYSHNTCSCPFPLQLAMLHGVHDVHVSIILTVSIWVQMNLVRGSCSSPWSRLYLRPGRHCVAPLLGQSLEHGPDADADAIRCYPLMWETVRIRETGSDHRLEFELQPVIWASLTVSRSHGPSRGPEGASDASSNRTLLSGKKIARPCGS